MDKTVNEILGIQETEAKTEFADSYSHEKILRTIATIILIVGIIATLIMLFTITFPEKLEDGYRYITERKFSAMGFLITILTCLSSITIWAILNVLSNISINLFEIKDKIKGNNMK
ncbi:MAG: hypothetical protein LBE13_21055 [Bacteroidales bacterium]|jgi:hypothetical protein|nr:hypothetical protein [Bacteroidales bacterium]